MRGRQFRIINATCWRSDDIRKVVVKAMEQDGVDPQGYTVKVEYARGKRYHGRGSYTSKWIKLIVPRATYFKGQDDPTLDVAMVARIAIHEFGHNRGLHHSDMSPWWEFEVPWTADMRIRLKDSAKPKPPRTGGQLREERYWKAKDTLIKHTTELLRLEGILKSKRKLISKWRQKVRYYERVFDKQAAAPAVKEPPCSLNWSGGFTVRVTAAQVCVAKRVSEKCGEYCNVEDFRRENGLSKTPSYVPCLDECTTDRHPHGALCIPSDGEVIELVALMLDDIAELDDSRAARNLAKVVRDGWAALSKQKGLT